MLSGVQLTLVGASGIRGAATTDSNGNVTFVGLVPGTYQVKVNGPGME